METLMMPRETALLLALLTQLQQQWRPLTDVAALQTHLLAVGVSAAPSASFCMAEKETVEVRGIAIGDKLFVHFVARETALRLDLLLSEYTKPEATDVNARTHTHVGQWVVSTEMLQWRLERNVFPVFGGAEQRAHVATSAGAELGRLPEPLLLCIAPFLMAKEYCGMTQTNKFLHEYADKTEIWQGYLENDFSRSFARMTVVEYRLRTAHTAAAGGPTTKSVYVKMHERKQRHLIATRTVRVSLPPLSARFPDFQLHDRFVLPGRNGVEAAAYANQMYYSLTL